MKGQITDKQRLDFLQAQQGHYTGKAIFRFSISGRGWRLHETSMEGGVDSVRSAIDIAIRRYK